MAEDAGRGWGPVVGLGLTVLALSVVQPLVLIVTPLALLLAALPPRRPRSFVLAGAMLAVLFMGPAGDPLWYAERGWGLVLGAWFMIVVAARPHARFLPRAITATACSMATASTLFWLGAGDAWTRIDWLIGQRFRGAAAEIAALGVGAGPTGGEWGDSLVSAIYRAAEVQTLVYPSLLALASLAGLGVAWWLYRWLTTRQTGALGPLREFRFRDELVWLLIAGIVLVVLPLGGGTVRAGSNLLAFMTVMYTLRGVGVLLALAGGLGVGGALLAAAAVVLLYPLVMLGTFLVGLIDTWLDLRTRWRASTDAGS